MVETLPITIEVDARIAKAYNSASKQDKLKLAACVNMNLSQLIGSKRSLEEIMDEMSREAQSRGLTPEILESILKDE
ncbi:MAG TPA: hypothetical protein VKX17_01855 [Planctomycetota bacterium]|nr:hypothetical protein [Planctomycetota bacterium]